ncbi:MAG: helix-turn-helix domain-containing protein [Candidatus Methylomirabilis sp.]|nr:helix-turn-helix domain-containing protein [Deltaproteobacteria bacterium]
MHPEDIKAGLRKSGTTPAALARTLKVDRSLVSRVIFGRSKSGRVARAIARKLGKKPSELWPQVYGRKAA